MALFFNITMVALIPFCFSDFTKEALSDYDRFSDQKIADVKKTLELYASLQLKLSRQAEGVWIHLKEAIQGIP